MEKYVTAGQPTNHSITWRMRTVCWILNTTGTHSEYVLLNAFKLQQWLYKRASLLRHTQIAYLVEF